MSAHQGAARVGDDAIAQAAEQRVHRLAERLAAQVPARDVDGRQREREDAAGAGGAGGPAQLGNDGLHARRILADGETGQCLHGGPERRRERAAEEGHPDPDEPLVGPELQRDELAGIGGRGQTDDERIVGGRAEHASRRVGDLHRWPPPPAVVLP
jgi:hypothetical protein